MVNDCTYTFLVLRVYGVGEGSEGKEKVHYDL